MADIKAKIRQTGRLKGSAKSDKEIVAQTLKLSAGGIGLGDIANVNAAGQTDGAMLIYDEASGKYVVTTQIQNENLNIIGGTY